MSNLENTNPSIDPEIIKFFHSRINPNLTQEQITSIVNWLDPQPKPILGQIINVVYVDSSSNLAAIVIQIGSFGETLTLAQNNLINADPNTIEIVNLNDFQFRLQEAFNHQFTVSINYENDKILSLVIINSTQNPPGVLFSIGGQGNPPPCIPGYPMCPKKSS